MVSVAEALAILDPLITQIVAISKAHFLKNATWPTNDEIKAKVIDQAAGIDALWDAWDLTHPEPGPPVASDPPPTS